MVATILIAIGIGLLIGVPAYLLGKRAGSTTKAVKNKERKFGAAALYRKIVIDGKRCLFLNEIEDAHKRYLKNTEDW